MWYELDEIVVTIHGVETLGQWQDLITPTLCGMPGLEHQPYVYGPVAAWGVSVPLVRRREIDRLALWLRNLQFAHRSARLSVIAHSFGTHLLVEAFSKYEDIKLHRIVLCGSIVDRDYDWSAALAGHRLQGVRNETCEDDRVVRLFEWSALRAIVPGSGPSGVHGFRRCSDVIQQQHFHRFTHSTQLVSRHHCEQYWLPFIRQVATEPCRDLCQRCLSNNPFERNAARLEFGRLYDPAIRSALRTTFRDQRAGSLRDVYRVAAEMIIESGRHGVRTFDELLNNVIRVLRRNVR
jgi:hypothetical protein